MIKRGRSERNVKFTRGLKENQCLSTLSSTKKSYQRSETSVSGDFLYLFSPPSQFSWEDIKMGLVIYLTSVDLPHSSTTSSSWSLLFPRFGVHPCRRVSLPRWKSITTRFVLYDIKHLRGLINNFEVNFGNMVMFGTFT